MNRFFRFGFLLLVHIEDLVNFIFGGRTFRVDPCDFFVVYELFELKVFRDNFVLIQGDHRETFLEYDGVLVLA
jgi:hypothetical protein